MANRPLGQNVRSSINATSGLISGVQSAVGGANKALSALGAVNNIASAFRSGNLPLGGESLGDLEGALASFGGGGASEADWRVRLNLANWSAFRHSPVLQPLIDAGGLIFPYTPTITMQASAKYETMPVTQTNYTFPAFKNSDPGNITINAPMNVEDQSQALYWIGALHYLRSLTKMFSGSDPKAGNPPPVVYLNGYGQYVFKNVPVVVTSFNVTLPKDADYIGVNVVGSAAGAVAGFTDTIGSLSDSLGLPDAVGDTAGVLGDIASLAGTFGIGGSVAAGFAYVPTKSEFSVTVQPIYSRDSARKFSLDRFVTGGYLSGTFGYI